MPIPLYVENGYVVEGYFVGDAVTPLPGPHGEYQPEVVKIFGFSKTRIIISDDRNDVSKIKRRFKRSFGRTVAAFPVQKIGKE